ncbi:unnamed protein product, partial [Darwinula stevensoni]
MTTTDVENYPGYPNAVTGPKMMNDFQQQAERVGTEVRFGLVTKVDFSEKIHKIWIDDEKLIQARTVIIATGAKAKWLGIPSETRLNGSGVSACAVCDGFFYKGKEVGIVGAGDTACEEALYLSKLCPQVHMIVRRSEMRASKIMQDRVINTPNIKIYWNSETEEILGDKKVEAVRIKNNQTQESSEVKIEGFFVAIGHEPNASIFKSYINTDEAGYIITEAKSTRTNVAGVFAAGDVQDKIYRQAVTSAGSGCMAALDAERYLAEHFHYNNRVKSIEKILKDKENKVEQEHVQLHQNLSVVDLASLGIAAIIGAGVFSTIGSACADGGPAVSLLFLGIAVACGFSALCYAEFASRIPIAGSAYTYAYATFGEIIAWIIGWDLILEYAIGNITVSIAWAGNFVKFLQDCGVERWLNQMGYEFPYYLTTSFLEAQKNIPELYATAPQLLGIPLIINLPAFFINFLITVLVYIGIKESKRFANGMVVFKIIVILIIIGIGIFYVQPENWSPFAPNGFAGVIKGVSAVFFAYIGFDAISTTAEECKNPQKDLPRGMFYALIIATILYVLISLVLTGMVHYTQLNNEAFLANAFTQIGMNWMGGLIAFSALIATASVLLVFQIGQPRIWMSISRDGLLPKKFSEIHHKYKTPAFATIATGILVDLCSIGTLFAFALVCAGVLVLQARDKKQPIQNTTPKFKVPNINGTLTISLLWLV